MITSSQRKSTQLKKLSSESGSEGRSTGKFESVSRRFNRSVLTLLKITEGKSCSVELRPYQQEAIRNTILDLRTHDRVGIILPTGAGKTEVFVKVAEAYLDENPDKAVLVLSHLSILTKQTYERFQLRAKHLRVGVLQGSSVPMPLDDVVISTMQTSSKRHNAERLKDIQTSEIGLIIVDEAHHIPCESYRQAIAHHPNAKVLGCTATPFRDKQLMLTWFDKISASSSLDEMITDGYLVKPELHVVSKVRPSDEDRIGAAVRTYKAGHNGQKGIVYLRTKDQAKLTAQVFEREGIKARAIIADSGDRDFDLNAFANGDVNILTTCDVLTAGYDCDLVEVILMPFPTQSPSKFMQRIGRGLRRADRINKTKCTVYYYGEPPRFSHNGLSVDFTAVLKRGGKDKKYATVKEDLEYNDFTNNPVRLEYTKELVRTIDALRSKGYPEIAKMMNERTFPQKFMKDLGSLLVHLKAKNLKRTKATDKQMWMLIKHCDFTKADAAKMSKREASAIISAAFEKGDQWIVKEGKFKGWHVRDVPPVAKHHTRKKYPMSHSARLYDSWDRHIKGSRRKKDAKCEVERDHQPSVPGRDQQDVHAQ
jgi:superfamily II DNA or RNA helicase